MNTPHSKSKPPAPPNEPNTGPWSDEHGVVNPQKMRSGISRIWHATQYSIAGFGAGWREAAFRQEVFLATVMLPAAFWVGNDWLEVGVLGAVVVLVLITELLNTGVELAIDRIGPERHDLSKRAKDVGSAAVLLALILAACVWAAAVWTNLIRPLL